MSPRGSRSSRRAWRNERRRSRPRGPRWWRRRTRSPSCATRASGGELPAAPVAVLAERESDLTTLAARERAATEAADASVRARDEAERAIGDVRAEIAAERARLEIDPASLVQRARRCAGPGL